MLLTLLLVRPELTLDGTSQLDPFLGGRQVPSPPKSKSNLLIPNSLVKGLAVSDLLSIYGETSFSPLILTYILAYQKYCPEWLRLMVSVYSFLCIVVQSVLVVLEFTLSIHLYAILLKCNKFSNLLYWHVQLHSSYQGKYS